MKLLEVDQLKTYFHTDEGVAKAVDGVSFSVDEGEVLGIVGESGCGKSVTSLSIMGLVDPSTGRNEGGHIYFHGEDLLKKSPREMRAIRGDRISMIFQEPMTSLNPVFTIGRQISEALLTHTDFNRRKARDRSIELLRQVGIPEPEKRVDEYPHQLSGGMRQRVMIAMALSCDPELMIADEPTTALDVTIQAQILELLQKLRHERRMAIILITHDLGVISELADKVVVMYAGQVVEQAAAAEIFRRPLHPYTEGLIRSIPDLDRPVRRLETLDGLVPSLYEMPKGCHFGPRCPYCTTACTQREIPLRTCPDGSQVRCILHREGTDHV